MEENQVTSNRRLIVIGGSSGSLDALLVILPKLRADFSIPILLILHRGTTADNGMVDLLAINTSLHVKEADEKDKLHPGWMYLAPPDYHVLLETDGSLSLDASEKIHYSRPSIDVSFTSAAQAYQNNCIAVLLSGANADGAAAMNLIALAGGTTIVQDPKTATVSYMPQQAIAQSKIQHVLSPAAIAALLNEI